MMLVLKLKEITLLEILEREKYGRNERSIKNKWEDPYERGIFVSCWSPTTWRMYNNFFSHKIPYNFAFRTEVPIAHSSR